MNGSDTYPLQGRGFIKVKEVADVRLKDAYDSIKGIQAGCLYGKGKGRGLFHLDFFSVMGGIIVRLR